MKPSSYATRLKHYRRGIVAEYLALALLLLKGYWPLAMRYKTPVGEIDLILRRGKTLIFVEVKARARHDDAATALHHRNQQRVVRASQHFIACRPAYHPCAVRFDAVFIAWYKWPRHVINAFGDTI